MERKITEKKLSDRRFRKNEKAILEAFLANRGVLSARVIVKRAKISRATFYRHHRTVHEILPDYEKYILEKYRRLMSGLVRRKRVNVKTLYWQMLIFIFKNGKIFKLIIKKGNSQILEKMIHTLEPKIKETYRLPKNCEKMLKIYEKEIVGVIEPWIRGGFLEDEMAVLGDIMYLTETIRSRLMPLVK